jgi:hypothetical protein
VKRSLYNFISPFLRSLSSGVYHGLERRDFRDLGILALTASLIASVKVVASNSRSGVSGIVVSFYFRRPLNSSQFALFVSQAWIIGAAIILSDFAGIVIPIARWSNPISIVYQFSSCLERAPLVRVRSSTRDASICSL